LKLEMSQRPYVVFIMEGLKIISSEISDKMLYVITSQNKGLNW